MNNCSIEFIKIDIDKEFGSIFYKNKAYHVSISTYNRFLIPKLKPEFGKVLYLDVDIIATGDIAELYSIDLGDYALAAVKESFLSGEQLMEIQNRLNLRAVQDYFNAGVLLINNKKWQELEILNRILDVEKQYKNKLKYADQDVLNIIFDSQCKIIPAKYNYMTQFSLQKGDILLRHFNTNIKPWHTNPHLAEESVLECDIPLFLKYA